MPATRNELVNILSRGDVYSWRFRTSYISIYPNRSMPCHFCDCSAWGRSAGNLYNNLLRALPTGDAVNKPPAVVCLKKKITLQNGPIVVWIIYRRIGDYECINFAYKNFIRQKGIIHREMIYCAISNVRVVKNWTETKKNKMTFYPLFFLTSVLNISKLLSQKIRTKTRTIFLWK